MIRAAQMLARVNPCFTSTTVLNGGHRERTPIVLKTFGDCFGRLQYPPGILRAPVAEAPRDKLSATRRFSGRFRIRFEGQRQLAAAELRTHCGSGPNPLPPAPVRGAVCCLDKLESGPQT